MLLEDGELAAHDADDDERGARLADLTRRLVGEAAAAGGRHGVDEVHQVEVATGRGSVFAVIEDAGGRKRTLAVLATRLALPSLMFMDLRYLLADVRPAGG